MVLQGVRRLGLLATIDWRSSAGMLRLLMFPASSVRTRDPIRSALAGSAAPTASEIALAEQMVAKRQGSHSRFASALSARRLPCRLATLFSVQANRARQREHQGHVVAGTRQAGSDDIHIPVGTGKLDSLAFPRMLLGLSTIG